MSIMALQKDKDGNILPIGTWKDGVTIDGTSIAVSSEVFDLNGATDIRIIAVTSCYVKFGVNPTASATSGTYIPSDTGSDIRIPAGYRASVYGGKLNITPYGGSI